MPQLVVCIFVRCPREHLREALEKSNNHAKKVKQGEAEEDCITKTDFLSKLFFRSIISSNLASVNVLL